MNDDDAWAFPTAKKNTQRWSFLSRAPLLGPTCHPTTSMSSRLKRPIYVTAIGSRWGRTLVLLDILLVWPASTVWWSLLAALLLTYQCQLLYCFFHQWSLSCWIGHADSISWCWGSQYISSSLLNLPGFGGIVVSAGSLNQKLPAWWLGSPRLGKHVSST